LTASSVTCSNQPRQRRWLGCQRSWRDEGRLRHRLSYCVSPAPGQGEPPFSVRTDSLHFVRCGDSSPTWTLIGALPTCGHPYRTYAEGRLRTDDLSRRPGDGWTGVLSIGVDAVHPVSPPWLSVGPSDGPRRALRRPQGARSTREFGGEPAGIRTQDTRIKSLPVRRPWRRLEPLCVRFPRGVGPWTPQGGTEGHGRGCHRGCQPATR